MDDDYRRLSELLLEKNPQLTEEEARTWVELLWEDFETTYAKAGRKYRGKPQIKSSAPGLILMAANCTISMRSIRDTHIYLNSASNKKRDE